MSSILPAILTTTVFFTAFPLLLRTTTSLSRRPRCLAVSIEPWSCSICDVCATGCGHRTSFLSWLSTWYGPSNLGANFEDRNEWGFPLGFQRTRSPAWYKLVTKLLGPYQVLSQDTWYGPSNLVTNSCGHSYQAGDLVLWNPKGNPQAPKLLGPYQVLSLDKNDVLCLHPVAQTSHMLHSTRLTPFIGSIDTAKHLGLLDIEEYIVSYV